MSKITRTVLTVGLILFVTWMVFNGLPLWLSLICYVYIICLDFVNYGTKERQR